MTITINGNGTIGGLTAGGLPDGTVDTDVLAANAVTEAKLGSDQQKGLAKAWVNFNGVGTVAIRASYNVTSITDNGTGDFTINFTTAMTDTFYTPVFGCQADQNGITNNGNVYGEIARFTNALGTASARTAWGVGGTISKYDPTIATVAIFR